jgi:hypothetical protein
MTHANSSPQTSEDIFDKTFELYKLIIEENRHLHQVWIDNFRVILTFNSILLTGVFALLTILSKANTHSVPLLVFDPSFAWALRFISFVGIVVTIVGAQIIHRIKAITSLRLKELIYLETTSLQSKIPVLPFKQGACVINSPLKQTHHANMPTNPPFPVEPICHNYFTASSGYHIISMSFIIAYVVFVYLSMH